MTRLLFLLHRYLGIGVGFLLLLWCLSGFVMMYVQFPELSPRARLSLLEPLRLEECCTLPQESAWQQKRFESVSLEMGAGQPLLRAVMPDQPPVVLDLQVGRVLPFTCPTCANAIASQFRDRHLPGAAFASPVMVHFDQWTVTGNYAAHRPLYRYTADDAAATQWYVSGTSSEIVLVTTGAQRAWNLAGAVVHWLYPTLLRQHPALWTQSVIILSLLGTFLTLAGLYIGVHQFFLRRQPRQGLALWHHYSGLVFGVLTLAWVLSGMLSMNPLGMLEGEGAVAEQQALRGDPLRWDDVQLFVERAQQASLDDDIVQLSLVPMASQAWVIASRRDGSSLRLDARTLQVATPTEKELRALIALMLPGTVWQDAGMLSEEDAYYYERYEAIALPVYRAIADDDQARRYYLSPQTGALLMKVDSGTRNYRWWFTGLHRLDFAAVLRMRPWRDALMWFLLLGVTLVCGSGTWMAWRRLR